MIPCKRPKVTVEPYPRPDNTDTFQARCHVPGCGWYYSPALKSDAQQQATWHRNAHRAAVPATNPDGTCSCGWAPGSGVVTAVDRKAYLDHHLTSEHGLVVCP